MKILKSWLNDWIEIENISSEDISEALESLGFEIESRTDKTPNYKNITIGKVLEIYDHPNADKVRVTKVDVGSKTYEIVQTNIIKSYAELSLLSKEKLISLRMQKYSQMGIFHN